MNFKKIRIFTPLFLIMFFSFINILAQYTGGIRSGNHFASSGVPIPLNTTVSISGNTGVGNAVLSWVDNSAVTDTADSNGNYLISVSYGWSGAIVPALQGYVFTPDSISYTNLINDTTIQNYVAVLDSVMISGNAGKDSVVVSWFDGIVKTDTTGLDSLYSIKVPYGWTGSVIPSLEGYLFSPDSIQYSNLIDDTTNQNYIASLDSVLISGNAGMAGVVLNWFDGSLKSTTTSIDSLYSINVPYGWIGTVVPSLEGYLFTPDSIEYSNLIADTLNQDYLAVLDSVTISGNAGMDSVVINWFDGVMKTDTTGLDSLYSINVPYGWTGAVIPTFEGYVFTPDSIEYSNLKNDTTNQNYIAIIDSVLISGNAGMSGVLLSWFDGTVKNDSTGNDSLYAIKVPYGWSGTVIPALEGYLFSPDSIEYATLKNDTTDQNYVATIDSVAISGNAGMGGVAINWFDGSSKEFITGVDSLYSINVSYGWTGTVIPSFEGYVFSPDSTQYSNLKTDTTNQNYTAILDSVLISGNAGMAGVTLSWFDGVSKSDSTGLDSLYSIKVPYGWTGAIIPSLEGYLFTPDSIEYSVLKNDTTNQNYLAIIDSVSISGNGGMAGAKINWFDGTMKTDSTGLDSLYSINVSYGWTGSVVPSFEGYLFTPDSIEYSNLKVDTTNQNYNAIIDSVLISGNAGKVGVVLSWLDGTSYSDTTGADSLYSILVPYGWTGSVVPYFEGYVFTPDSIVYSNLKTDSLNQDYTAEIDSMIISGNTGIGGVALNWIDSIAKSDTADSNGNYSIKVVWDWTGTVIPSIEGYTFSPDSISYTNLKNDTTNQNYSANLITFTISGNVVEAGVVINLTDAMNKSNSLKISTVSEEKINLNSTRKKIDEEKIKTNISFKKIHETEIKNFKVIDSFITESGGVKSNQEIPGIELLDPDTSDINGDYSVTVPYNWSGTVTPSLAGFIFTPLNRDYTNVQADQTGQDYTSAVEVIDIAATPQIIIKSLPLNGLTTEPVIVSSINNGTINYNFIEDGGGISWLSISPQADTIIGFSLDTVLFSFNAAGLSPGSYTSGVTLNSNDKDGDIISILVHLNVYDSSIVDNSLILAISDSSGPGNSIFLNPGIGSIATDGIDPAYSEIELPPPLPLGTLDARFLLPDGATSTHNDYRSNDSSQVIWKINFQPGPTGYPMKFLWDLSSFPNGSLKLVDAISGTLVNIDMRSTNYYELTNQALTSLCVVYKDVKTEVLAVTESWNLISVPYLAEIMIADTLFPTASSEPFWYSGVYIQKDTLENGKGYWLKFSAAENISVAGIEINESIPINTGWNLIGVHHKKIPVPLTTNPAGIINSSIFGYDAGLGYFKISDSLKPGYGYWVKASAPGVIEPDSGFTKTVAKNMIAATNTKQDWGKLIIKDSKNRNVSLYLTNTVSNGDEFNLPPVPPVGAFDVRYSNDKNVLGYTEKQDLNINSAIYPITITAEGTSVILKDKIDGSFLNAEIKDGEQLQINNKLLNKFSIERTDIPRSYELSQNYPNPFNPSTTIKFAIPVPGRVKLTIYNLLGERVTELVDKELDIGFYEVKFNASIYASGVYFYKIHSGDFSKVKKMMLLK